MRSEYVNKYRGFASHRSHHLHLVSRWRTSRVTPCPTKRGRDVGQFATVKPNICNRRGQRHAGYGKTLMRH